MKRWNHCSKPPSDFHNHLWALRSTLPQTSLFLVLNTMEKQHNTQEWNAGSGHSLCLINTVHHLCYSQYLFRRSLISAFENAHICLSSLFQASIHPQLGQIKYLDWFLFIAKLKKQFVGWLVGLDSYFIHQPNFKLIQPFENEVILWVCLTIMLKHDPKCEEKAITNTKLYVTVMIKYSGALTGTHWQTYK